MASPSSRQQRKKEREENKNKNKSNIAFLFFFFFIIPSVLPSQVYIRQKQNKNSNPILNLEGHHQLCFCFFEKQRGYGNASSHTRSTAHLSGKVREKGEGIPCHVDRKRSRKKKTELSRADFSIKT